MRLNALSPQDNDNSRQTGYPTIVDGMGSQFVRFN